MQTLASVRTRCERSVWALDFALPREYTRGFGRIEAEKREIGKEREDETRGWVRRGRSLRRGSRRESWSVNERERVRMRTSADDAKYRAGGAECAAAHLS